MKRGRPHNKFSSDPDRYVLALAYVFRELGASRRGRIEIAVACLEGIVVGRNAKPGWGRGLRMLDAAYELRRQGNADIADRARWLRRKMKDAVKDESSVRWLATMSAAWLIALQCGPVRIIRDLTRVVGEIDYAERVLVPVARSQPLRLPGLKKAKNLNIRPQTFGS